MSLITKLSGRTKGKGMDDHVPAMIEGQQPAALSNNEYVIPADVVSMVGDGSSDAGARILDQFCKQIRKQKGKYLVKGRQAPKT